MSMVVASVLVLSVPACSPGRVSKCENAYKAATTSVDGVASAEFECSFQFGGGWQRAKVVFEPTTEAKAIVMVDKILRAMAASPDLEDSWGTPQEYATADRSVLVSAGDVGFKAGVPNVGEVRQRFGITPR
ncbi:hypothetical protein FB561_0921 [Kribbella amoyensis]|uniref:Uncharacterized protein n=2 Tax=Kribbella amoyensis TaxID=996641 RepID=A0A561BLX8_9ACTN|nr:hypothetical protein FB561_0921 [Kribbella amoyensis]